MNIDEALHLDVIAQAEKQFNKHWSEFDDDENRYCLLNARLLNSEKEKCFKDATDTYYGMKWRNFKELLGLNGFKEAYKYKFDNEKEEAIIFYKKEKGLILFAESYFNMDVINSGTIYGEVKAKDNKFCREVYLNISTGGCIDKDKLIYTTSHDIREGLFTKLALLEYCSNFLPYWIDKNRFLWFLDYTETKKENYDYKEITKNKINKCPPELQDIIYKNIDKG